MKLITSGILFFAVFSRCSACVNTQFYPAYHYAPPFGWMNDPNGFCFFRGEYHLFYQYNPKTSLDPGIANWGHTKSEDLFRWVDLPIAMKPDEPYDKSGVFSGSALIEDEVMYLFYTGNVNFDNATPEKEQTQELAVSLDGVEVTKYENNPILLGENRQPNIRDPKVWKYGSKYYMVLGNSFNNDTLGRVLLYESDDRVNWKEVSVLASSNGTFGYMWECPDFFELNNYWILLFSPQGVKPKGDKYKNLYQTGYIVGNFCYDTYEFVPVTEFVELDKGHDFYASQTFEDPQGRRLLIAWFDMWEQVYPEREDGWAGQMTIVRELELTEELTLTQKPVEEIETVYGATYRYGKGNNESYVQLNDNTARIKVKSRATDDLELILEADGVNGTVTITYDSIRGLITLNRGGVDGVRRTEWRPQGKYLRWDVYVDRSSVELFTKDGLITFSSRFFPESLVTVRLGNNSSVTDFTVRNMLQTMPLPSCN